MIFLSIRRSQITSEEAIAVRETYGPYPLSGTSNINLADFDSINVTELTFKGAYQYIRISDPAL